MEQNNPAPTPTTPTPAAPSTPTPASGTTPSASVVATPKKPGMGGKRPLIMALLLVVILVVLGALGYYYYTQVISSTGEVTAVPSLEPEPTGMSTGSADEIKDESELDGVVNDLDNATDEANMNKEVQGLQSDSNF